MARRTDSGYVLTTIRRFSLPVQVLLVLVVWAIVGFALVLITAAVNGLSFNRTVFGLLVAISLGWTVLDYVTDRWWRS